MQQSTDFLNQFEIIKINRRQLLPWWMKFFCWLFMIFGVAAAGCLLLGLFGIPENLALYGLESNQALSATGITIILVAIFKGIAAFSLWFEKDYAIILGTIDAIVGIIMCVIFMTVLPLAIQNFHATIRLELVLLIPYLIKLRNIQAKWNQ
ncbi:MAG TPA: hypothetical protein VFI29_11290 [Hanamia sp.]|nr:hypothetical protein [Hanamia sp.]